MLSLKYLVATLALSTAFITAPAAVDAKIPTHVAPKHVSAKAHPKKVHRKHALSLAARKKLAAKSHKPLAAKTLHGKKPLAGKPITPGKTSAGWHHHGQVI